MNIDKPSLFRRPVTLLGALFALSLASPSMLAAQEVIFSENFESLEAGAQIGTTENAEWKPNGFVRGQTPGSALAAHGEKENATLIAITTPEADDGNGGTVYNLTAQFPEASGTVRLTLDVFPQGGSGQVLVRPRSVNPGDSLAYLQFRGGRDMAIQAFSADGQGGKAATPIGKFRFNRWYKVTLTLHLAKPTPSYDVEVTEIADPSNTIGISGLECPTAANAAGNLLVGSIFSEKSRFGWDNIKVERVPAE